MIGPRSSYARGSKGQSRRPATAKPRWARGPRAAWVARTIRQVEPDMRFTAIAKSAMPGEVILSTYMTFGKQLGVHAGSSDS